MGREIPSTKLQIPKKSQIPTLNLAVETAAWMAQEAIFWLQKGPGKQNSANCNFALVIYLCAVVKERGRVVSIPGMQPRAIRLGKSSENSQKPAFFMQVVGVNGVEPLTPRLSSACSNQLSYTPRISLKSNVIRSLVAQL